MTMTTTTTPTTQSDELVLALENELADATDAAVEGGTAVDYRDDVARRLDFARRDVEAELADRDAAPGWRITNRVSGTVLGTFEGVDADAVVDAMCRDAGYSGGAAELAQALDTTVEALRADLLVEEVAS